MDVLPALILGSLGRHFCYKETNSSHFSEEMTLEKVGTAGWPHLTSARCRIDSPGEPTNARNRLLGVDMVGGGVTVIPAGEGEPKRLSGPGSCVPEFLGVGVKGIGSW